MALLSAQDIAHLGRLARLDLSQEEQDRFSGQLSSVVEYVEQLRGVPTDTSSQLRGVTGMINVLAEDRPRSETDLAAVPAADLINGAPVHDGNFFVVRAVLGAESGAA